jgi:Family of unknown function (DUF6152)
VFEADVLVQNAENSDGPKSVGAHESEGHESRRHRSGHVHGVCTGASFLRHVRRGTVTLQGTVTQFRWTNPHSWLHVAARDERTGKPAVWAIELDSPARLIASGIRADYLRAGDTVSVSFHPSRDGTRRGQFIQGAPLGRR